MPFIEPNKNLTNGLVKFEQYPVIIKKQGIKKETNILLKACMSSTAEFIIPYFVALPST